MNCREECFTEKFLCLDSALDLRSLVSSAFLFSLKVFLKGKKEYILVQRHLVISVKHLRP